MQKQCEMIKIATGNQMEIEVIRSVLMDLYIKMMFLGQRLKVNKLLPGSPSQS